MGALAETVNVVSETTLLQTEKADLSTELKSKEIVNLPLNQFRNYQALINLVPGATPAQFQNAEIDTPGRSLRTWVNGTQPNNNATRIDGAVSVNIWLPHHVGYVSPAETIDTVNVSTNNFDADQGMAGGAAITVVTKSGTNELHGSAFWFRNQEELNANSLFNNAFGLRQAGAVKQHLRRHPRRPDHEEQAVLLRVVGALPGPRRELQPDLRRCPPRRCGTATSARWPRPTRSFQLYDPLTGGAGGVGRTPFAELHDPGEPDQPDRAGGHGLLPAAQHEPGPQLQPAPGRLHLPRAPVQATATTTTSS